MKVKTLKDLQQIAKKGIKLLHPKKTKIMVGMGTCGLATGAGEVFEAISAEVKKQKLDVVISPTCCIGFCQKEPLVDILQPGRPRISYGEMTPERARELIKALAGDEIKKEWALAKIEEEEYLVEDKIWRYPQDSPPKELEEIPTYGQLPFYAKQCKIAMRNCGFINPENIEEYIARGGYRTLYKVLKELKPEEVISEITKSGLRGRGGAGFPTGRKWGICHKAKGDIKYIICNGDEGDPGAYMDRSVLEGDPHSVLEGMIIGAYAIGASEGYIYVRAEYPLAVKNIGIAIKQAEEYGLLGENIFGSGFNFTIKMDRGAGAFVCGEETALIAALEGRAGEPRLRPPYPAQSGLWGKPTNINNVETWANVPAIMARGADWYSQYGTETSKGTKVFSLVGKIENTGLVEVPMGITLREIVYDVGGGIPGDKKFKAVQTGGPSGGTIPPQFLDTPVDYERLTELGAIMGSGGMIVMDEETCMVDVAKYFVDFLKSESCGKCTSCREGIERMHEVLTDITVGKGKEGNIELLEELCDVVRDTSLCALGGTAPNPVLTTLRYFRDEYEQHIKYKRCPAMVCNEIIFTPCKYNCPVNTDVPAFIAHIARGEYREAFEVIRAPNPFPISCGYICHHPCEDRCRSAETGGGAMAIKALKRFVVDYVIGKGFKPLPRPKTPILEKVAIVGSGPAGLAAAFDLARMGYQPTVFEASSVVGGNLTMVIPEFRLPRRMVDLEIEHIKQAGVGILTNTPVGPGLTLDDLFAGGYKAILLAVGAHKGLKLDLPGEDSSAVMDAYSFLEAIKAGKKAPLGEKVGVIGGGNAAIDAARTAIRAGAGEATIIYRRSRAEMPAIKREIQAGIEEGVKIVELAAPSRIISQNGQLTGVECLAMKLGEYDDSGRRRPIPIPHSEFILPVDNIILAIGEEPDLSFLTAGQGLEISDRNTILTDPETLVTGRPGVFAAGDAVTGPSTIADSIASGKLAALSIHKFLQGQPITREYAVTPPSPYVAPVEPAIEEIELHRVPMPCAPVAERVQNFGMVELGLTEEMALEEARRCLRCDLEAAKSAGIDILPSVTTGGQRHG